jgi:tetratricopeptide (TPR) repeat protein
VRRRRPPPSLSPAARAWITAFVISIVAAAVVLGGIWGTMTAYESYQSNANRQLAMNYFNGAKRAFDQGDYDQAARGFLKASQVSPGSDVGRVARRNAVNSALAVGSQRQNRGDTAGAEAAYENVLQIDPGNAQAYAWLAVLLFGRGQRAQAFAYWDRALALWNQQFSRGEMDAGEARDAHQGLVTAEQNYARALLQQAEELYAVHHNGEAMQDWQRVLEVAPGSPEAMMAQRRLDTVGSAGMGIFPSYMGAAP